MLRHKHWQLCIRRTFVSALSSRNSHNQRGGLQHAGRCRQQPPRNELGDISQHWNLRKPWSFRGSRLLYCYRGVRDLLSKANENCVHRCRDWVRPLVSQQLPKPRCTDVGISQQRCAIHLRVRHRRLPIWVRIFPGVRTQASAILNNPICVPIRFSRLSIAFSAINASMTETIMIISRFADKSVPRCHWTPAPYPPIAEKYV